MDSTGFHGVPLSTTGMAPKTPPLTNNNTLSGIRAPLTADDSDFEYSVSSRSRRNSTASSYYSGSELESDGFVSGDDEGVLEKTQEFAHSRPFEKNLNGNGVVVQESSSSYERGVSKPFVESSDGKIVQGSGIASKNGFFRPFVRKIKERNFDGSSDSDEGSSPFMSESDEEISQDNGYGLGNGDSRSYLAGKDKLVLEKKPVPVVDIRVRKANIIAQISADSDVESQMSEVSEDNGFSGVVRVSSIEVLQRINSVPKVRIFDSEEEEDYDDDGGELQAGDILKAEFIEQLADRSVVLDRTDEEKSIGVEDPIQKVLTSDEGPDANEEVGDSSLVLKEEYDSGSEIEGNMVVNEEYDCGSGTEGNKDFTPLDGERCLDLTDHQEIAVFLEQVSCSSSTAELGCHHREMAQVMEPGLIELGSTGDFGDRSMDDWDLEIKTFGEQGIPVFNQKTESDTLENKSDEERDQSAEPFCSTVVLRSESAIQDIGFSETETLCEEVDMSDDVLKNDSLSGAGNSSQFVLLDTKLGCEMENEVDNGDELCVGEESSIFHSDKKAVVLEMAKQSDSISFPPGEILQDIYGQDFSNSDEDVETEGIYRHIIDSATLAALLRVSNGADTGIVSPTSFNHLEKFSIEAGSPDLSVSPDTNGVLGNGEKKSLDKIHQIRIKYLRLLHRLGRSLGDSVAARVLDHLATVEARSSSQAFHIDPKLAMELELQKENGLDFSVNILVIGKTGVGKSATINSIFGERKTAIDAFKPATTELKEIVGTINGVRVKVFDTPGLQSSFKDYAFNRKVLLSIKKLIRKSPPDVVLYVDRLDTQTDDFNDLPILKSVTGYLGSPMWRKSIIVFTHASSLPLDGPNGSPLSYDVRVAQRSEAVQEMISRSSGETLNPESLVQVCLVENRLSSKMSEHEEKILYNGESWRSQLLFLCCSMKIMSEVNSVVLAHRPSTGFRIQFPSLPNYLYSLLKSNATADSDLQPSDSNREEDDNEYDNLPPFKPLKKSEIAGLSKEQRKAYFDEYDYCVELLKRKRSREAARKAKHGGVDQETIEKLVDPLLKDLPPSFDGMDLSFRYRLPEPLSPLRTGPVSDPHGWDHDIGYDGIRFKDKTHLDSRFPATVYVRCTKDKREFDILLCSSVSAEHGDKVSSMAGLDIETAGDKRAYILKGEAKIKNFRTNKTLAGAYITFYGGNMAPGLKIEDHIALGKRCILMGNVGIVQCQGDFAYGSSIRASMEHKDYPFGLDQSSLELSILKCRDDLFLECMMQSRFPVERNSRLDVGFGLRNDIGGKISVKANTSDQPLLGLLVFIPMAKAIFRSIFSPA